MSRWFLVRDGQRESPLSRGELDELIARGEVGGDTLVWSVGMSAWMRAAAVTELRLMPPAPVGGSRRESEDAEEDTRPDAGAPATNATTGLPTDEELAAWAEAAAARDRETARPDAAAATDVESRPAGFRIRLAAKLLDGIVLYALGLVILRLVVIAAYDGVPPHPVHDPAGWWELLSTAAPFHLLAVLAYQVYFIRRYDATPGKRLLGLRLVRPDGASLGVGRVIARHFAEQLSFLLFLTGYVMAAFDPAKRTLHDILCDTRVVRPPRPSRETGALDET